MSGTINLTGRALKVAIALDPVEMAKVSLSDNQARVDLRVAAGNRLIRADVAAKAVRKAIAVIQEHGPDNVALILQGKLVADKVEEAGVVAQQKTPKVTAH